MLHIRVNDGGHHGQLAYTIIFLYLQCGAILRVDLSILMGWGRNGLLHHIFYSRWLSYGDDVLDYLQINGLFP